jgi:hypothetical protein
MSIVANVIHAVDRRAHESIASLTMRANEWLALQDVPNGYSYEYVRECGHIVALMIAYSGD